jgi:hypothetical protein
MIIETGIFDSPENYQVWKFGLKLTKLTFRPPEIMFCQGNSGQTESNGFPAHFVGRTATTGRMITGVSM